MSEDRRASDVAIAEIKADIRWIRDTLKDADLPNRVSALERSQARTQGALALAAFGVTLLLALAKTVGVIH